MSRLPDRRPYLWLSLAVGFNGPGSKFGCSRAACFVDVFRKLSALFFIYMKQNLLCRSSFTDGFSVLFSETDFAGQGVIFGGFL